MPRGVWISQKRVRLYDEVRPCAAKAMDLAGRMHGHGVSGIMRIPRGAWHMAVASSIIPYA